jgi:hypothetical protein
VTLLKVQQIKTDWSQMPKGLTWYIIGQPKTWKTTQASKWSDKGSDGVLIVDTDLGSDFVDGAKRITVTSLNPPKRTKTDSKGEPVHRANSGTPEQEIIPPAERGFVHRNGELAGQPMEVYALSEVVFDLCEHWSDYGIDTVVIDTIDIVNDWIEAEMAPNGMKWEDYGKTMNRNLNIMQVLQQLIKKQGGNLVLISHSKKSFETDGKIQLAPDLPSKLSARLTAKADVIGYTTIDKKTQQAHISFVGYDERSVGSRLEPLQGKELPFSYDAIREAVTGYKHAKH